MNWHRSQGEPVGQVASFGVRSIVLRSSSIVDDTHKKALELECQHPRHFYRAFFTFTNTATGSRAAAGRTESPRVHT